MNIFRHGHVRKQRIVLENHVDIAFIGRQLGDIFAVQDHFAGGRGFQTGDHTKQRGLAAAGGTQQCYKFTIVDGKIQRRDDKMLAKLFGNPFQTD